MNIRNGFTLAELLISLLILGVIATFTIPKILNSQSSQEYKARAKETVAMVSAAYQQYQLEGNNPDKWTALVGGMGIRDLTPYMNYVAIKTVGTIDGANGAGLYTCDQDYPCMVLHSGAVMQYATILATEGFDQSGSSDQRITYFHFDPDGFTANDAAGKGISFFLCRSGRVKDWENIVAGSSSACCNWSADATKTPSWFSW